MTNQIARLPTSASRARQETREYLIGMIGELSKLARCGGEVELAIYLKAILDASRIADRTPRRS